MKSAINIKTKLLKVEFKVKRVGSVSVSDTELGYFSSCTIFFCFESERLKNTIFRTNEFFGHGYALWGGGENF